MNQRAKWLGTLFRLFIAAASGAVVAATAYLCTYYDQRDLFSYRDQQLHTLGKLNAMEQAIKRHRSATGQFPTDLTDLPAVKFYRQFTVNAEGRVVDIWDHPFQYRFEGDSFELFSLGADGLPGGVGRDADLYPNSANRPPEVPTLRQFTIELATKGIRETCVAAGILAAIACFLVTRKSSGPTLLARATAVVVGSILVAIAVTSLQSPSGR